MTEELGFVVAAPSQTMNKVKNLRTSYVKAVDWKSNTGQGVEQGTIESKCLRKMDSKFSFLTLFVPVTEYVKRICPHFEPLDEIFGHKTNIVPPYIYESLINDQQVESPQSYSEVDYDEGEFYLVDDEDAILETTDALFTGANAETTLESTYDENFGTIDQLELDFALEESTASGSSLNDCSEQSRFKRFLEAAPPKPKPSTKVNSQQISPHVSRFKKRLLPSPVVEKDRNMARNSSSILAEAQQKKAEAILGRNEIEKARAENEKLFKFEEAALAKDELNFEKETRKSELDFKEKEMELLEKEIQSRERIEMYRIELEAKNNLEIAKLRHS